MLLTNLPLLHTLMQGAPYLMQQQQGCKHMVTGHEGLVCEILSSGRFGWHTHAPSKYTIAWNAADETKRLEEQAAHQQHMLSSNCVLAGAHTSLRSKAPLDCRSIIRPGVPTTMSAPLATSLICCEIGTPADRASQGFLQYTYMLCELLAVRIACY